MASGIPKSANIVIVGAGPVGLTAAVELKRLGFSPRVLEKDKGPHVESRALGINPRTLDILSPSGATDRLLAAGAKARAVNLHAPDGRILFRLQTRHIPHPAHTYMLVLPQADTEKHLIETLGGRRVVEWNAEVTKLTVRNGQPRLTLQKQGKTQTLNPDIVIGADGARSTVRKALGIGFEGEAYEHDWGLLDARFPGLPQGELHIFDLSPLLIGFIPIRGDLFRVVADTPDVLEVLPGHLEMKEIVWQSRFRISHRLVETYQQGPVFLAGDAAHIHSPLGGRGMNLGIEDAAWLAYLIDSGETDQYSTLRRPVAKKVLAQVDRATRFMASSGAIATFLRRRLLPLVADAGFVQKNALRTIAGLSTPPPPWLDQA